MKSTTVRTICLLTCVFAGVRSGLAQGCAVTMTRNFSYYFTESTDTAKIYTTVIIDGSSSCTPSPGCPCSSATHTPKAYNKLGSVGGWTSGTPTCVNCYISYGNSQNIPATAGVEYAFIFGTQVACSLAGTFYSVGLFTAKIHWGHDYLWFDDPIPIGMTNKCSWALADSVQCHSTCRAIIDPLTAPCFDANLHSYVSTLDIVPWIEVQFGSSIKGIGLNQTSFEVIQGSTGPPSACSSVPAHWGTSW